MPVLILGSIINILFENITSAIFIADKELKVHSVNNTFLTLFGQKQSNIYGRFCGNIVGCAYSMEEGKDCGLTESCKTCVLRNTLLDVFLQHVPAYKKRLDRDFYINNKIQTKHLFFTAKYMKYKNQEVVLVIIDDLTEFEKQKKEFEKLNEEKNAILGMASHDLRNPVGAAKALSGMLIENIDKYELPEIVHFLNIIHEANTLSLSLLNELLDISKIQAGKLLLNKSKSNYIGLIKRSVSLNKYKADKKDILLSVVSDFDECVFNFDERKIEQVLNNLIDNAIKYSECNTNIIIKTIIESNFVVTHVQDKGLGIPENEIDKLFNPFQTTSTKATQGEKSTGLGLVIAKRIVEEHKGTIWTKSRIDEGSVFSFKLPLN